MFSSAGSQWTLEAKQQYENTKEKKYLNEISKYNYATTT